MGGSSAGSYLADPTSPIPSHCASIVVTSTLRNNAQSTVTISTVSTTNKAIQYQKKQGNQTKAHSAQLKCEMNITIPSYVAHLCNGIMSSLQLDCQVCILWMLLRIHVYSALTAFI